MTGNWQGKLKVAVLGDAELSASETKFLAERFGVDAAKITTHRYDPVWHLTGDDVADGRANCAILESIDADVDVIVGELPPQALEALDGCNWMGCQIFTPAFSAGGSFVRLARVKL